MRKKRKRKRKEKVHKGLLSKVSHWKSKFLDIPWSWTEAFSFWKSDVGPLADQLQQRWPSICLQPLTSHVSFSLVGPAEVCVRAPPQLSPLPNRRVLAHLLSNNTGYLHRHARLVFMVHVHVRTRIHTQATPAIGRWERRYDRPPVCQAAMLVCRCRPG